MSAKNYRNVEIQINTTLKNLSSDLTDQDAIDIIHRQLNSVFGLYIDRDQITIKENKPMTKWERYKKALLDGDINAETFALLTADLPKGE